MKNAPENGARGGAADEDSLARNVSCPDAPECRHITPDPHGDETADCRYCGQTLDRADLRRLYLGPR